MLLPYDPTAIVRLREAKQWSQAELARRSGLSQPSVHDLEKGNTKMPKYTTLKAIADALGVPMTEILARRPKGESAQALEHSLRETFGALSQDNKANLYAIALSLLAQQKSRK
jgi:transcriptional regulator with XRE-family HTH domain